MKRAARPQPPRITAAATHGARTSSRARRRCRRARLIAGRLGTPSHECGEPHRIPVGEAEAAVRLRLADCRRFRRAMEPQVGAAQIDPDDADRIVGPGRDLGLRVRRIRIPEQRRVVVEDRQHCGAGDGPLTFGERVLRRCRWKRGPGTRSFRRSTSTLTVLVASDTVMAPPTPSSCGFGAFRSVADETARRSALQSSVRPRRTRRDSCAAGAPAARGSARPASPTRTVAQRIERAPAPSCRRESQVRIGPRRPPRRSGSVVVGVVNHSPSAATVASSRCPVTARP